MILAAGLSPAWQQIIQVDDLHVGDVNRARDVHWCASGKVLNVGLALHALATTSPPPTSPPLCKGGLGGVALRDVELETSKGREPEEPPHVLTLALVGGSTGRAIQQEFAARNVRARWIESHSPTRVCTTILDSAAGTTTELVEQAGPITEAELNAFCEAYRDAARRAEVVVLTGSLPEGAPVTLFRDLLEGTRGRAIVDAQGPALLAALEARPFLVKPNREELGRTLNCDVSSESALHAAMRELGALGAQWVVVTEGKRRVWIGSMSRRMSCEPPTVEAVNPIGSGDCLAAGIAFGSSRGLELADAVALGVAAGAQNACELLPSRIDFKTVESLARQIS